MRTAAGGEGGRSRAPAWAIALCLLAATAAAYHGVFRLGFVFDDSAYVTENRALRQGLGAAGVRWAFTTELMGNWTPLALLSHLADYELFGLRPAGHHGTSLALHLAAVALLFAALLRATGARGRSALVAALFALHPLHVESVAWVAERKDVLSGVLWMAALLAYLRYCARPGTGRYALLAGASALCLLAKPMTVTLPLVLLLLDYWPLGRWRDRDARPRLLAEKLPLLALAAAVGVVTLLAQARAGTVHTLATMDVAARAKNALVAYGTYVAKTFWPDPLAAYYPMPTDGHGGAQVAAAAALLAVLTALGLRRRTRSPYLLAGWAWFVVTLLPVIGLLPVGMQSMADRYTYLPLVGLGIALAWGGHAAVGVRPRAARAAAVTALLALAALGVRSAVQVRTWTDDLTLFRHAAAVTPDHWLSHYFLGLVLAREGRFEEALGEYRASLAFAAAKHETHAAMGESLRRLGRLDEAVSHLGEAVRLAPGDPRYRTRLGAAVAARDRAAAGR